ncbi:addiction module toxin, HicA family [Candidatus Woesearchaeota archaeon]|nr:addiction module toxin, HicA family [Candidatus Woesearchaeota archaeon]
MKLPLLSAKELQKFLEKEGFRKVRQKGSHMFFSHSDGRTTVVPRHNREKLDRGLLLKIIKQDMGISRREFLRKR